MLHLVYAGCIYQAIQSVKLICIHNMLVVRLLRNKDNLVNWQTYSEKYRYTVKAQDACPARINLERLGGLTTAHQLPVNLLKHTSGQCTA